MPDPNTDSVELPLVDLESTPEPAVEAAPPSCPQTPMWFKRIFLICLTIGMIVGIVLLVSFGAVDAHQREANQAAAIAATNQYCTALLSNKTVPLTLANCTTQMSLWFRLCILACEYDPNAGKPMPLEVYLWYFGDVDRKLLCNP